MNRNLKLTARAALGWVLGFTLLAAQAQAWTTKPVIFHNPFLGGGGTDTFARPIAAKLTQSLGQSALIDKWGQTSFISFRNPEGAELADQLRPGGFRGLALMPIGADAPLKTGR